jgi:hypothetical protein
MMNVTKQQNRKIQIKYLALGAILVASTFSCVRDRVFLPPGWRSPIDFDLGNDDDWRKEDADGYLVVRGDFNGDGIIDGARLLIREDGSGMGLFAFVSQENYTVKAYLLDENTNLDFFRRLGIAKVSPGKYETACGKGYTECGADGVDEISIRHDAIDYFLTESAHSYCYWDTEAGTFRIIWISD